jgi:hypothetical protein
MGLADLTRLRGAVFGLLSDGHCPVPGLYLNIVKTTAAIALGKRK